ncbi:MAG: ATP-binding protein [Acidobacteriota bacterium]
MATRELIRIDEEKCDGCGLCVPACAEGAIAIVDGKARLVSESFCDGMGACLGHCPQGAITVERVEAAAFDEAAVARHLASLRHAEPPAPSCPGSRPAAFEAGAHDSGPVVPSALRHWPVQLHLLSPAAPFFRGADVLLAADCVAFALGGFHGDLLAGRSLAIACPKLDSGQESYLAKLVAMIDEAEIASLTVAVMEVPCCSGLVRLARTALERASRQCPLRIVVVGIRGDVLADSGLPLLDAPPARPFGPALPVL